MNPDRPFADGRRSAVLVFTELRGEPGRLTQAWLSRIRALDDAGWATHVALIKKQSGIAGTVRALVADGQLPASTVLHQFAQRDRRIRPSWWGPLPPGQTQADRVADWLDWLTGAVPGAVVFADSPVTYPYVARMTNPLVARVAGIHLSHLATDPGDAEPALGPMTARFAEGFAADQAHFDSLVVATAAQAEDLRHRFGPDTPVITIPPAVAPPTASDRTVPPEAPGGPRIISVGDLEPASGHDRVIRALATITPTSPDARLEVVGEGDLADALLALAAELGVADRVSVRAPAADPYEPYRGATLTAWAGRRESVPLPIIRSLACGVPVVAMDVRYGPAELITAPELGDLVGDDAELAAAMARRLAEPGDPGAVRAAAGAVLRRTDPRAVGTRWVALAGELGDLACDHRAPTLLAEALTTASRVIRVPAVLADASGDLDTWSFELPGLIEPAGWLTTPTASVADVPDDDEPPIHPHAAGPTREVFVTLRSNALAFVAVETDAGYAVEFTDGTARAPLRTMGFADRVVASRVGNALLQRRADGSVWVEPYPHLLYASNIEGRLLVRADEDAPASDITHAIDWAVDLDWADLVATDEGAQFRGTLRATSIAPAEDSPPAICVSDVGGFSRIVGQMHYTSPPTVDGLAWSADVAGVLRTDPLVATTELARGALALHVGFRGLLVPVGGLWTHGERTRMVLSGERGEVTLLPSPGGRVLVAPGKGLRARISGAVRTAMMRG